MIDDEGWDRWMAMTDAEQDAEIRREVAEFNRLIAALTLEQHAAMLRRMAVDSCLTVRHTIARIDLPIFRENLRSAQRRLLKIREYRGWHLPGRGIVIWLIIYGLGTIVALMSSSFSAQRTPTAGSTATGAGFARKLGHATAS